MLLVCLKININFDNIQPQYSYSAKVREHSLRSWVIISGTLRLYLANASRVFSLISEGGVKLRMNTQEYA